MQRGGDIFAAMQAARHPQIAPPAMHQMIQMQQPQVQHQQYPMVMMGNSMQYPTTVQMGMVGQQMMIGMSTMPGYPNQQTPHMQMTVISGLGGVSGVSGGNFMMTNNGYGAPSVGMIYPQMQSTQVQQQQSSYPSYPTNINSTPQARPTPNNNIYMTPQRLPISHGVVIGVEYASPETPALPMSRQPQPSSSSQHDHEAAQSSPSTQTLTANYGNSVNYSGASSASYANLPVVEAQSMGVVDPPIAVPAPARPSQTTNPSSGGDNEYFHAPESNPAFQGLQIVSSSTQRVIRDPEEDFTVENEVDLMYCPLYFKSA
eukprot:scaffold7939_cov189-Ochromonas_danica.AAC.5